MGNQASGFAYDLGELVPGRPSSSHWQLYTGKKKSDGSEVSLLKQDKVGSSRLQVEGGQHAFGRIKALRHPCVLPFLDGVDLDKETVIVTEPVKPLKVWLTNLCGDRKEEQVIWGLRCLLSALDFLNHDCKMTHGMICPDSIYVSRSGDWKLGGMDLVTEWKVGAAHLMHFQTHESITPSEYRAPERRGGVEAMVEASPPGAMDIWAVGVMIQNDLLAYTIPGEGGKASAALINLQRRMVADNPKSRPTAGQLLKHTYFASKDLVTTLSFVESFSLKDEEEKVMFLESLGPQIGRLPPEVLIYKVLPLLRNYVVHIGGSDTGGTAATPQTAHHALQHRRMVMAALPSLLQICSTHLNPKDFASLAEPLLLPLFEMNDRGIRLALLSHLPSLAPLFPDSTVNGRLLDALITGFHDSVPQLREMTLKSMLCLTDRLSDKNMNDRLLRLLAKLHADPEPSIRTNTTIFIGRIATHIKEGNRAKVLVPAFLKACGDPFPHARLAGVKAASACVTYLDATTLATKMMPIMDLLLVDPDSSVREAAFQCHDAFYKVLQANSRKMKEEEEMSNRKPLEAVGSNDGGSTISARSRAPSSESTAMAFAGWAVQKLVSSGTSLVVDNSNGPRQPPPPPRPLDTTNSSLPSSSSASGSGGELVSRLGATTLVDDGDGGHDGWGDDGWDKDDLDHDDDDDAYFDAVSGGGKSGKKGGTTVGVGAMVLGQQPQATKADGWGGNWDLDLGDSPPFPPKPQGQATVMTAARFGLKPASPATATVMLSPAKSNQAPLATSRSLSGKAAPLSADDLLNMLADEGGAAAAAGGAGGFGVAPKKASSEKMEDFRKRQAERRQGRLQAKKMQSQVKDDWDDF